jgi:hypothetical protein
MNHSDLQARVNRKEISLEDFMMADTSDSQPYEIKRARRNGRKQAERLLKPAEPETVSSLDSADIAQPRALISAATAIKFMLAGNAYFTLRSTKTGTRYTYRVSQAEKNERYPDPAWFVSVLTGPENTSDYQYAGLIRAGKTATTFAWTQKSKLAYNAPSVEAFRWTFTRLAMGHLPSNVEIWHEGRCGRCGRMLTVPESITLGLGPECAGRM